MATGLSTPGYLSAEALEDALVVGPLVGQGDQVDLALLGAICRKGGQRIVAAAGDVPTDTGRRLARRHGSDTIPCIAAVVVATSGCDDPQRNQERHPARELRSHLPVPPVTVH